ncbi:GDP-mannose 4,6-dehydratase [Caulobacter sp. BK020]|uniref:NAD-dependent epimerase/dehydratase family protein n=1 Tax=Caulobacter sp. BK020 TaxID=2512117 RepID=UPI0010E697A6|nr:GDP-mannose 4,6-dehydratase [Caulobacter sp. BK020]TCS10420.1 GDP-4-dehydro-6-deoxy-D-mannose reductase [Caulobacter sp. BK020]
MRAVEDRRILVTGASGFVGRALVARLRQAYPEAALLGAAASGQVDGVDMVRLDLASTDSIVAVTRAFRPTDVIHLAAQSSVQGAFGLPRSVWETNVVGVLRLIDALRDDAPDASLVFASSGEAYGRSFLAGQALDEDAPLQPENPYARSKAAAEMALRDLWGDRGRLVILRMFNHLGPGQDERFVAASFAAQVARAERGLGPPVIKVGDLSAERDFGDIRDLVEAYVSVLDNIDSFEARSVFNVCSGTTRPVRDIADLLMEFARIPISFEIDPARVRPQAVQRAAGSHAALTAATGWRPAKSFRETILSVLEGWRNRA